MGTQLHEMIHHAFFNDTTRFFAPPVCKSTGKLALIGLCTNVSTTPITAMGCRQCLPLSVVQLKGKQCQKNPLP